MHTIGLPQRKYVYPAIMILGLFLYLMRFGFGADTPPITPERVREGVDVFQEGAGHAESDFINAADRFNDNLMNARDNALETRAMRHEDRVRELQNTWKDSTVTYPVDPGNRSVEQRLRDYDRYGDSNYIQERRRLDDRRQNENSEYRDKRQDLQNQMSGYNRNSDDYNRLERELHDLDREHADQERKFEQDFQTMDATYSFTRW